MNATISPARVRAAGLSRFLRLTLRQTARVAVVGFVPFGLAAVVTASTSGTVSTHRRPRGRVLHMLHLLYLLYRVIGSDGSHLRTVLVRSRRWRGKPGVRLPRGLLG